MNQLLTNSPKWTQNGSLGAQMGAQREPLGPKWKPKEGQWVQNGAQMGALGPKWEPKGSEEDPRRVTTAPDPPKVTKLRPKWLPNHTQNGASMASRWDQNGAQICSGGKLEGKLFAGNLADPLAGTSSSTLFH